ncbi:LacI family DNA-binding transcriptional regulator [Brachybacterium sp. J153]|uniref:LacI family DNA-binding transcriptional regulator n=1 Tax=Brachybacterium sp. J153 TaxID=3116488 RepID=UPI002E7A9D4E|nr:substrate-binding domain-containing protein [Brachybacterium sp. J153]MEE1618707.1 substrate-binding domain-containing protein [Brachybacterium sp. J153]
MSTFGFLAPQDLWDARSEMFFSQVLAGVEDEVAPHGHTVVTLAAQSPAEEMAIYRRWAEDGAVRAVVLRDLREGDPRPALLDELGLGYVLLGDVTQRGEEAAVLVDNAAAMRAVLAELRSLGHERIAHLGGPADLLHSRLRRAAFLADVQEAAAGAGLTAEGDYSEESGAAALARLLSRDPRPTAVVCDNDAMAIGALEAAPALGVRVPEQLSIIGWEDSMSCQLHEPPVAVLGHSLRLTGSLVGRALQALVDEPPRRSRILRPVPVILPRGTLGAVRGTLGAARG